MNTQKQLFDEMMRGYVPLEDFTNNLQLTFAQKLKVQLMLMAIALYRIFILPFRKSKTAELERGLKESQPLLSDKRTSYSST